MPSAAAVYMSPTGTPEFWPLSLHDALPIWRGRGPGHGQRLCGGERQQAGQVLQRRGVLSRRLGIERQRRRPVCRSQDRKSTRLNSSHSSISYAVFCLKKNNVAMIETDLPLA